MNLHILPPLSVKDNVTRIALWVSLAALPLGAANVDLNVLLKGVEQRYNHAKTLQVQYNETYSVQGKARKSESGTLTLRKPGRMRWDYSEPPGKLFQIESEYSEGPSPNHSGRRARPARRVERYWLCDACAGKLTLTFDQGHGIATVPLPEAARKRGFTTLPNVPELVSTAGSGRKNHETRGPL